MQPFRDLPQHLLYASGASVSRNALAFGCHLSLKLLSSLRTFRLFLIFEIKKEKRERLARELRRQVFAVTSGSALFLGEDVVLLNQSGLCVLFERSGFERWVSLHSDRGNGKE